MAEKEVKNNVTAEEQVEVSIEKKLEALYTLQQVDSKIDKIRAYRGELPLEVQDLEDEVAGLETRIKNFQEETKKHATDITNYKIKINVFNVLRVITKYDNRIFVFIYYSFIIPIATN